MSKNLTALAVNQFDSMVKTEYQAAGFLLDGTTQIKRNVKGATVDFNLIGQGIAQKKISQDDVPVMNPIYSKKTATLSQWSAADYTDIFDQQEVLFDEKQALAKTVGMAIGRRKDQIVIDSAEASTTANVIAEGGANMTYVKFISGVQLLNKSGVSRRAGRRFFVMSDVAETALLQDDKFINNDYVQNSVLNGLGLDGQKILGVEMIVIPDMTEGGLPKTGDIRTCFLWHEFAMGLGMGIDFKTEINYIAQKTSWLVNGIFKAGATEVDNKGIVKINIDETK
ncbi:MAG: phage capsid protein [Candidatus Bathyarchaeia archaeon]